MSRARRFSMAAAALILLAFVDVIVLEKIYKPLSRAYDIPWENLSAGLRWAPEALWWHVAFIPLALGVLLLIGFAASDWRFSVGSSVLFFTGWEDLLYYALLRQIPPARLPWLDRAWGIAWTRVFQPSQSVSRYGLLLACILGLAIAYLIFSKGTRHSEGTRRRKV